MKSYIKKLLRESLLSEDFLGGKLYGYHVTSKKNLDSIRKDGLNIGSRSMQGKGLYGFYSYDHAFRYAMKGEVSEPIIIKFYVKNPHNFLYLNMDIAKEVLGSEYGLMNQIESYFSGGFDWFYSEVIKTHPNMSREDVISKIQEIEEDNSESNQRNFLFSLISSDLNNSLNIVWNGYYGLEFRIAKPRLITVVGYDEPNFYGKESKTHEFSIYDDIPADSKYDDLREFFKQNLKLDSFDKAYYVVKDLLYNTRNIREYEYYNHIYNLLGSLK